MGGNAGRGRPRLRLGLNVALGVLFLLFGSATRGRAQIAMPDPKEMSGIPRPVGVEELPNGSVSVRLIRGELSNNIPNHPVELQVGDNVQTVKTDEQGRAQFDKLPAGASVKAIAVIDGERLESQVFPAPSSGGIRLMLVATDKEKAARAAAMAKAPAVTGQVILGTREPAAGRVAAESRIHIEPGDEIVDLFYFLDIVNDSPQPVSPPSLFTFEMPTGSVNVSLFKESQGVAAVEGTHVRVPGPFPPGKTSVQVFAQLPVTSGELEIVQTFPATWEQVFIFVERFGDTKLTSPQIFRQQEVPSSGGFMAGGGVLKAGEPLRLTLSGLPHHSATPRRIAVTLAVCIALAGVWLSRRRQDEPGQKDERKRLIARREKLFQDLVRLENDHRNARGDGSRYEARREELVAALERVYGALDTDDPSPGPSPADRRSGLAA